MSAIARALTGTGGKAVVHFSDSREERAASEGSDDETLQLYESAQVPHILVRTGMADSHEPPILTSKADKVYLRAQASAVDSSTQRGDRRRSSALASVRTNGNALVMMSSMWKADRQVVLEAVRNDGYALRYATAALKDDHKVVKTAVMRSGLALMDASDRLKDDWEIVMLAVRHTGRALKFASVRLKAMHEVVLRAVATDGEALEFACETLRSDWQAPTGVVYTALEQNGIALQFVPKEGRANKALVMASVQRNGDALCYASAELQADRHVVMAAVQETGNQLDGRQSANGTFRRRDLGNALAYASPALQADIVVALVAVLHNQAAEAYVDPSVAEDLNFRSAMRLMDRARAGEDLATIEEPSEDEGFGLELLELVATAMRVDVPEAHSRTWEV